MARNALQNEKALNRAVGDFLKLSMKDAERHLEKAALFFFQRLQVGTPKDTGRATQGWMITLGPIPTSKKPPIGLAVYAPSAFPFGQIKIDQIVWLSNNVEYIQALEEGHSQQAPHGFSSGAFQAAILYVEAETAKLSRKKYNV